MSSEDEDESVYSSEDETGKDLHPDLDAKIAETLIALKRKDAEKLELCKQDLLKLHPVPRGLSNPQAGHRQLNKYTLARQLLDEVEAVEKNPEAGQYESDQSTATNESSDRPRKKQRRSPADIERPPISDDDDDIIFAAPAREDRQEVEKESRAATLMKQYFERSQDAKDERTRFLESYFVNELWKRSEPSLDQGTIRGPGVTVSEFKVDDDLDAQEIEAADNFETAYNHRFEEKGGDRIKGYARDQPQTISATLKQSQRSLKRKLKRAQEIEECKKEIEATIQPFVAKKDPLLDEESVQNLIEQDVAAGFTQDSEWFLCDGCESPIQPLKVMFVCKECPDFALCKTCQKSIKHEHSLRKSKAPASAAVPRSWKVAVNESRGTTEDENSASSITRLTAEALRSLTKKTSGFKYVEVEPIDFGLTDQELLELDEPTLNTLAPPAALDPYESDEKVGKLVRSGTQKVIRFRLNKLKTPKAKAK